MMLTKDVKDIMQRNIYEAETQRLSSKGEGTLDRERRMKIYITLKTPYHSSLLKDEDEVHARYIMNM